MNIISWLFDAQITIGDSHILWREIIGNAFGIASAFGGMYRRIWAWPIGIIGNVLLFTVFMGTWFNTPQSTDLIGQSGRQILFIAVSIFGWYRWYQTEHRGIPGAPAVVPHWAGKSGRLQILIVAVVGIPVCRFIFEAIGNYGPSDGAYAAYGPWLDAWIFIGSALATYGMARGWTEFWLIWMAVDVVGVPFLIYAKYYPSAILYGVFMIVVIYGFTVWLKAQRTDPKLPEDQDAVEVADVGTR